MFPLSICVVMLFAMISVIYEYMSSVSAISLVSPRVLGFGIGIRMNSTWFPPFYQEASQYMQSEILMTVAITTLVNLLFFGFVLLAKSWVCDSYQFGKDL